MTAIPEIMILSPKPQAMGWRYLWLKYVSGFNPRVHCARCLIGPYSKIVARAMPTGKSFALDEALPCDYLYLCGVSWRGWESNLHLAFVPDAAAGARVVAFNGDRFLVNNARQVDIPALDAGFAGKPESFTTCRNWRFGVAHYGQQSTLQASALTALRCDHQATPAQTPG